MRRIATLSRALERGHGHAASTSARGRLTRPPTGPSCSRWLSCSCCRQKSKDKTPFRQEAAAPNSAIPPLSMLQRMQTPHLPLPPPLPWSPDSAPFLRHMQILSLALMSPSADESWEIYSGLHPDLREAIPDDVFISLLAHQLGEKKKFARVLDLLKVGRRCDMNPRAFSFQTLEGVISNLLRRVKGEKYDKGCADVLDWLWPTFIHLNGDSFAGLSHDIRTRWLNYMVTRHKDDCETVFAALEDLVEQGGAASMAPACSRVVVVYRGHDPTLHRTALRLATWCIARDIDIEEEALRTLLHRLNSSLVKQGENGVEGVCDAVNSLVDELVAGEAHDPAQRLRVVLDWFVASQRTSVEKAVDLARDPTATMPKVHRLAEKLLNNKKVGDVEMAAAVSLCLRALKFSDADYESLLRITTRRLSQGGVSPEHIICLATGIIDSGILEHDILSPQLITRVFYAVADVVGKHDRAFKIAFHLYPFARPAKNTQAWMLPAMQRWLRIFHHAVATGHIHFASRLYADLQADGLTVPPSAQLAFIRKIAQTQSESRRVLLDRHIKDYLWDSDVDPTPLMLELCRGLSNSPDDAALAIYLCARIQPELRLPPAAVASLVTPLLTSARAERRKQGMALLTRLPATEVSREAFHAAVLALRRNAAHVGIEPMLQVYRLMCKARLESNEETASLFIGALLKAGEFKSAKGVFDAAAADKRVVHPAAVSSLMIKLAESGRTKQAEAVESAWRAVNQGTYDASMLVGARLFVDIMAGREVDLGAFVSNGEIVGDDGWKPTRPFFRWLESVRHKQRGDDTEFVSLLSPRNEKHPVSASVSATETEELPTPGSDSESTAEAQACGATGATESGDSQGAAASKQAVRPVTQSFSPEAGGQGGRWFVDRAGEDQHEQSVNKGYQSRGVGLSTADNGVVTFA